MSPRRIKPVARIDGHSVGESAPRVGDESWPKANQAHAVLGIACARIQQAQTTLLEQNGCERLAWRITPRNGFRLKATSTFFFGQCVELTPEVGLEILVVEPLRLLRSQIP